SPDQDPDHQLLPGKPAGVAHDPTDHACVRGGHHTCGTHPASTVARQPTGIIIIMTHFWRVFPVYLRWNE
ncbi:MAG: hypothetical protein HN467_00845, partial [Opitutae bacterium]|nr:hypothetical protein [Opitutae bacterium]